MTSSSNRTTTSASSLTNEWTPSSLLNAWGEVGFGVMAASIAAEAAENNAGLATVVRRNKLLDQLEEYADKARRLDRNIRRLQRSAAQKAKEADRRHNRLLALKSSAQPVAAREAQEQAEQLRREAAELSQRAQQTLEEATKVRILEQKVKLQLKRLEQHEETVRITHRFERYQHRADMKSKEAEQKRALLRELLERDRQQDQQRQQHGLQRRSINRLQRRAMALEADATKLSLEAERLFSMAIQSLGEEERARLRLVGLTAMTSTRGGNNAGHRPDAAEDRYDTDDESESEGGDVDDDEDDDDDDDDSCCSDIRDIS